MVSALSSLAIPMSKKVESMLGHFAGGVVLSACANELLPMVAPDDVPLGALCGGFTAGMLLMMGIRKTFPEDDDDDDDDDDKKLKKTMMEIKANLLGDGKAPAPAGGGAVPWGAVVPMMIDFVMDGILIGLSYAASAGSDAGGDAGFIMVVSLSVEKITLGSSTTKAMTNKGVPTGFALSIVTALALSLFGGAWLGVTVVAALQGTAIFYAAISFGIAALLWLVTEELLSESCKGGEEDTIIPAFFFAGFLIPMVLDKLGGD